ncbi:MAG TPA: hypothetical protein VFV38_45830 [Ktedonobacteraceae bacterium]|nr:hypothetical protein [Ktedonobacteraceae bacterium]
MKKPTKVITDPVVRAFDRDANAAYRLRALIDRVEEAIMQDSEQIRQSCPLEGGLAKMSKRLLRHLQQEQTSAAWATIALSAVLAQINLQKLARNIWPELKQSRKQVQR